MTIEQIKNVKTVEFFKVLSHEIRVKIISLLHENIEMSYTEILHMLNLEEGNLNFHLRKMKGFIELTEKKNYRLSDYGKIAQFMLRGVDARLWKDAKEIIKTDDAWTFSAQILMRRAIAAVVDFGLFMFPGVVLFLVLNHGIKFEVYTFLVVIYLQLTLQFAYASFVIMEAYNGQTIGKYLMNIRIVKTNGDKMTILESAVRNIGKVFLLPLDFLIGVLFYRKNGYIKFFDYYTKTTVERVI
ncbi:MAG: RDD family protein [Candidatus Methanoperedens sp.]|nr:RDD family protein [Candidatus Methanoperedens sp.]MCE8428267.1 RDD family protein [Candidatus Methanoperedens sp.]